MTLTQKDLDEIENLIDEKLDEKLKNLPTKDEFFSKMDEVMGELQTIRQEQKLTSHQVSELDDRVSDLETIHPHGQHLPLGV